MIRHCEAGAWCKCMMAVRPITIVRPPLCRRTRM